MSDTFRIKPLVWTEAEHEYAEANTLMGWFYVRRWNGQLCWRHPRDGGGEYCDSVDDGKAKAEGHYRERLMAALEPA